MTIYVPQRPRNYQQVKSGAVHSIYSFCRTHWSAEHATMMKLAVGPFREFLRAVKPVLRVEPSQDKTRMEHYVPLHPQVVEAIQPLLNGKKDDESVFPHGSFGMWVKRQKIPSS